jgi:hypothetical protein
MTSDTLTQPRITVRLSSRAHSMAVPSLRWRVRESSRQRGSIRRRRAHRVCRLWALLESPADALQARIQSIECHENTVQTLRGLARNLPPLPTGAEWRAANNFGTRMKRILKPV